MELLIASLLLLILSHLVPSAPGLRERLIATLGRPIFFAGYSLVSLAALGMVLWAYQAAEGGVYLYAPIWQARAVAVLVMPLAVFLVVARLTQRPDPQAPRGIYRITAVPGSLGVLLWALLHLPNLGEARIVAVFAAMALIALAALVKNWARATPAQRRAGVIPLSGILLGRQRLGPACREIGWGRPALALALYLALLALHPRVFGVSPLAGLP